MDFELSTVLKIVDDVLNSVLNDVLSQLLLGQFFLECSFDGYFSELKPLFFIFLKLLSGEISSVRIVTFGLMSVLSLFISWSKVLVR